MGKVTRLMPLGRVTLPADVQSMLGLTTGDGVEFVWNSAGEAVIRKAVEPAVDEERVQARMAELEALAERWKHLRTGRDPDEIMADLREPVPTPDPADL